MVGRIPMAAPRMMRYSESGAVVVPEVREMRDGEVVAAVVQGGRVRVGRLACQASSWAELTGSGPRWEAEIGRLRPDVVVFRRGDAGADELVSRLSEWAGPRAAVLVIEAGSEVLEDCLSDGAALIRELIGRCCAERDTERTDRWDQTIAEHVSPFPESEPAPSPTPEASDSKEPTVVQEGGAVLGTASLAPVSASFTSAASRAARLARLLPIALHAGCGRNSGQSAT